MKDYLLAIFEINSFSLQDIAKTLNIKELSLKRRLDGIVSFKIEEAIKLSELLKMSMDDIFNPSKEKIKMVFEAVMSQIEKDLKNKYEVE